MVLPFFIKSVAFPKQLSHSNYGIAETTRISARKSLLGSAFLVRVCYTGLDASANLMYNYTYNLTIL
jgi:hypothetical protein